ncbi:MAG: 30S ribosome-binding factor RbfA [Clostridiales bacterium]|nr:30S ribosome-binding factor RbfA [Clostridiales bacterium]
MSSYKSDRTAEDIKREIMAVLRELKDPRVAGRLLTVARVEISSDLTYAKVYVSALEGIETAREAVKGLECASGHVRREIGTRLHLRKTPELKFVADNSIEHGMEIVRRIDDVINEDKN